jgi:hypothetical protein
MIFAVVLVYLLMAVNFQSWLDPFIILMALPGAWPASSGCCFSPRPAFSVPSLMGSIMCIGVATANSILMVVFANDQREEGMDARSAALSAGHTRIRPVLMTAAAMIIGMLPMALGMGEGGEQNAPLGRAVIGGLLLATVTTLFVVPWSIACCGTKPPVDFERTPAKNRGNRGGPPGARPPWTSPRSARTGHRQPAAGQARTCNWPKSPRTGGRSLVRQRRCFAPGKRHLPGPMGGPTGQRRRWTKAIAAARSNLGAAEANLARLNDLQNYQDVRAPFAGVITVRNVDVGALVTEASTLLFRIAQTDRLRTYVNVPQSDADSVRPGQQAPRDPDLAGHQFPARGHAYRQCARPRHPHPAHRSAGLQLFRPPAARHVCASGPDHAAQASRRC